MDTFVGGGRRRRRHSAEFKAKVVQACRQPGVSMAAVALANGLNANLLRRWVVESVQPAPAAAKCGTDVVASNSAAGGFVPLPVPLPAASIRIELRRGDTTISVQWPIEAAAQCAAWLRDLA